MPKSKRSGKSYKEQYVSYKTQDRQTKNKVKQLERVCKDQPNEESTHKALKKAKSGERIHMSGRRSQGHICKGTPFTVLVQSDRKGEAAKPEIRRVNNYVLSPVVPGLKPKSAAEQLVELGLDKPRKKHARRNKKAIRQSV